MARRAGELPGASSLSSQQQLPAPLTAMCEGRDGDKGGAGETRLWQTIQPQGDG